MQLAKIPKRIDEISQKIAKRGRYESGGQFSVEDKWEIGINFFSSLLKVLSNKRVRKIITKIKEENYRALSGDIYFLERLQNHGIIERDNDKFSLTEMGERMANSLPGIFAFLEKAGSGIQNKVLLHLLFIEEASFTEIYKKVGLNVGSLYRVLENLRHLGLISKSKSGRYKAEHNLEFLKELCNGIIEEIKSKEIWVEDGEIRFSVPLKEFSIASSHDQKYFSLEDVIKYHIIVTYSYESEKSRQELVKKIIYEQTRSKDAAKPITCEELNKIKIGYEVDYISSLQHLINLFCLHGLKDLKKLLVEEIDIPKSFWKKFRYSKPRYGIKGIRKILDVKYRPLLHIIIPPDLKENQKAADFIKKLFDAGVDEICDNHFIGLSVREFEERVEKAAETLEKSTQESSHKILFYPYVEGEDFMEKIDILKSTGCRQMGIGLSPLTMGIPTTIFIRKNYKFPLHLHLTLHAVYTRMGQSYITEKGFRSGHGIHINSIMKIFALCGGDEVNVDHPSVYLFSPESVKIQCDMLRNFDVFPALVGDINLNNLRDSILNYGNDIIIKIGGGRFLRAEKIKDIPKEDRIKEFVGAYKRLIENNEMDENIRKWNKIEEKKVEAY